MGYRMESYIIVMYADIDDVITRSGTMPDIDKYIGEKLLKLTPFFNNSNQFMMRQSNAIKVKNLLTR